MCEEDDLAGEQEARDEERDLLDAQASEDAELIGHAQDATDALDPHAEEREALGFTLAWWADEGERNTPPSDIVVDLANQACGRTQYLRDLEQYGFDSTDGSAGYIGLNAITGPLVIAGLQILGTMHSHIRGEVTAVLKQLFDAVPDTTPEYDAAFEEAATKHQAAQFAGMGIQVVGLDDAADLIEEAERRRRDAQNN